MRLISCALTTQQIRDRIKTVTRRLGWTTLRAGELLCVCEKVMGLQGKPLVRLAVVKVVGVRREPLHAIDDEDVSREGFNMPAHEFIEMFNSNMGGDRYTLVTRIEFRYVPGGRL